MKVQILVASLVAGGVIGLDGSASAQFYSGGEDIGVGGAALLGSDYLQATEMQLATRRRLAGEQAAEQQNYLVQSGIRSTMSTDAQSQDAAILSQQQANQNWWFQQESQQMAQERARDYASPAVAQPAVFAPSGIPPPAARDIIQWPIELQEECFDSERAQIEAPYRRTPPKLSVPTPADYRRMASTIADMRAVLEWRLRDGIESANYEVARNFLYEMAVEVVKRAKAAGGSK